MNYSHLIVAFGLGMVPLTSSAIGLSEAEQRMQEHAPELAAARIELHGSQGDLLSAARRPVAELVAGTGKYSRREGLGAGKLKDKRLDSTVGIEWMWERGGKRRHRIAEAQSLHQSASLDLLDVARRQRELLHAVYYSLKAAAQTLDIAEDNLANSTAAIDAIERRVQSGDAPPIERDRLSIEHLKLDGEWREAQLGVLEAQQDLALLIGHTADPSALSADDDWPQPADGITPDLDRVLSQRADLRAAEQRVDAARNALALANSQRKRDIGLSIEAEREPSDVPGVTWGFSVSVPLHGPRHFDGERVRAEANQEMAELELQQARRDAAAALRQLRRSWEEASARLELYEARVEPAATALRDGMELAYQRGGASLTDLLDARRAAREAEQNLIDARLEHAITQARWLAAIDLSPSSGNSP